MRTMHTYLEVKLLELVCQHQSAKYECATRSARSDREFDLDYMATQSNGVKISGWLPLAALSELCEWPAFVAESDHPSMDGDWSAIRDSDFNTIWRLFDKYVRPKIKKLAQERERDLHARLMRSAEKALERLNGMSDQIALAIVEAGMRYFKECPEDFCVQSIGSDRIVFGGWNRIVWSAQSGFRPDRSSCTAEFLAHYDKIKKEEGI